MTTISKNLPAENIRVISQTDFRFLLSEEQRDSAREWFYWKFKAVFDKPGHYVFRFERPNKVGTRSAAYSLDCGKSWQWLSSGFYSETQEFSYDCKKPEEVWFCQAIPYLQGEFDRFANVFSTHPAFHLGTLCKSRKGRAVELVTIREGNPRHAILLTSRHHCQEMAATHALEGFLRAVLSDDEFGRAFRHHFSLFAVPFVDKDGVEDGDQGKGRIPRDHGRDYYGESIYPETRAIRELIERESPFLLLDLHCPWLRYGNTNEQSYIVENAVPRFQAEIARLSRLLQKYSTPDAPFHDCNKVRWGVSWNRLSNRGAGSAYGKGLAAGNAHHSFVRLACTLEIPFANFGEKTMTRTEFLRYGASIAHAVSEFGLHSSHAAQFNTATLCLTGALMTSPQHHDSCPTQDCLHDKSKMFSRISSEFRSVDCCVSHLLTTFQVPEEEKSNSYLSDQSLSAFVDTFDGTGFSLVSTAFGHCFDNGIAGLSNTLDMLDRLGIEHTGTFRSPEEQNKPLIRYVNGIRIAFIGTTFGIPASLESEASFAINGINLKGISDSTADIRARIAAARDAGAEYVISLL
ncbi:MAG: CapA family protein, partial [Kiritimatiellia bacterium]